MLLVWSGVVIDVRIVGASEAYGEQVPWTYFGPSVKYWASSKAFLSAATAEAGIDPLNVPTESTFRTPSNRTLPLPFTLTLYTGQVPKHGVRSRVIVVKGAPTAGAELL